MNTRATANPIFTTACLPHLTTIPSCWMPPIGYGRGHQGCFRPIDRTHTSAGRYTLYKWLDYPLTSAEDITPVLKLAKPCWVPTPLRAIRHSLRQWNPSGRPCVGAYQGKSKRNWLRTFCSLACLHPSIVSRWSKMSTIICVCVEHH